MSYDRDASIIMNLNLNRKTRGTWRSEIRHYEIGELLGKGAFSYVNKAIHKPDRKFVAIKIVRMHAFSNFNQ